MFQSTLWLDRICHHFLLDDKLRGGKLTLSKIEILQYVQDKELPDGSLQNEPKRSFMVLFSYSFRFPFSLAQIPLNP